MGKTSSAVKWKYNQKAYDRIAISVPKGDRDRYRQYAEAHGETLSGLIKRLLDAECSRTDMRERSGSHVVGPATE